MAITLYDANGDPIKARENRPILSRVAVPTMRDNWDSYPSHGLTPRRLAEIFKAADQGDVSRQVELFMELEEKDSKIGSGLSTRRIAVQGLPWSVTPAAERGKEPTPEEKKIADYVDEVLREIANFDEWIFDALDAIGKGYSISEIGWELSESEFWVKRLDWVDQRKFTWDMENHQEEPRLVTAQELTGVPITAYPGSFVYHRHKCRSGKPSRGGIIRTCAWMYLFKNYSVKDWVVFCEVFGMPLRLGKFDPSASDDEKSALRSALQQLGTDGAGIISKNAEIEFVEAQATGSSSNVYESLAKFANDEITLAILGQLATSDRAGGFSKGQAQENVREDLRASDARQLAKTIREQLVVRIVDYNFGPQDRYPDFSFAYEAEEDLASAADTLEKLVKAGARVPQSYVREKWGIPEGQKDEEFLVPPGQAAAPAAQGDARPEPPPAKAAAKQTAHACTCAACAGGLDVPDSVDLVVEEMMEEWEQVLDPLVGELMRRIQAAASFEEVQRILVEAAGDPELAKALQEALLAGQLAGRALGDVEVRGG